MTSFSVKPNNLSNTVQSFKAFQNTFQSCSDSINDISQNLAIDGKHIVNVKLRLEKINKALLDEAVKASSLREALSQIANVYRETEKNISGVSITNKELSQSDTKNNTVNDSEYGYAVDNEKLMYQFRKRTAEIRYKILDSSVIATSHLFNRNKINEEITNILMSDKVNDLLKQDQYSEQTWNISSLEERKNMLIGLLAETNAVMGLNITNCEFKELDSDIRGQYNEKYKTIRINLNYIDPKYNNDDSYEVMKTVIHEMRHAYQHAAINNPDQFIVSEKTRKQWENNFLKENYKRGDVDGYQAYVEQPVEYDAKRFAQQYEDIIDYTPKYVDNWGNQ